MRTKLLFGITLWLAACAGQQSPAPGSASQPSEANAPAGAAPEANAAPGAATQAQASAGAAPEPHARAGVAPEPIKELAIPGDLVAQISRSSEIGRQLFVLDRIAAMATDVLFAKVQDVPSRGLQGYLALPENSGGGREAFLVSFFTQDNPPRVAYVIRFERDQSPAFQAFEPPKAADAAFVTLARARQLALAALTSFPQPLNPLVLPASLNGEEGILVYLLAGTSRPNVAVLGKHYRFLFPKDASTISYMRPLSNDILEIPTRAPDGATPEALAVTQLVTDFPLETHVLASLQINLPIVVGTRRGVWHVDGDRISFLGEEVPGSPPAP